MARTPLLIALRRALRIAQIARHSGREPSEIRQRDDERAVSRRDFLAAGAAAAAASAAVSLSGSARLLAAAPDRLRGREHERVIVIGAGIRRKNQTIPVAETDQPAPTSAGHRGENE